MSDVTRYKLLANVYASGEKFDEVLFAGQRVVLASDYDRDTQALKGQLDAWTIKSGEQLNKIDALAASLAACLGALKWMAKHGTPAAKAIAEEALAEEGKE